MKLFHFSCVKTLCCSLGPLHGNSGVVCYEIVNSTVFLTGTLNERDLFPEIRGQIAAGLNSSIKGGCQNKLPGLSATHG